MRRLRGRLPRRPQAWGLLACAALVAAVAVGSLVLALRGTGGSLAADAPKPSARATLSSRSVLFFATARWSG